jgi:hypothetical protein
MNRGIDVRAEVRKLAGSKPVYAAAGVGALASQALRELPARLAKLRHQATVSSLPAKASEYLATYMGTARTKAAGEYERLASRGRKALNGRAATPATSAKAVKGTKSTKTK